MDAMHDPLMLGIGLWGPAMGKKSKSGVTIRYDPSCADTKCLCADDTAPDTVVVKLDSGWHATTGFTYGSVAPGRHNPFGKEYNEADGFTPYEWDD